MCPNRTFLAFQMPWLVPVVLVAVLALSIRSPASAKHTVTILGINDTYRIEDLNGGATGTAPRVEGRICDPLRPGSCLAVYDTTR